MASRENCLHAPVLSPQPKAIARPWLGPVFNILVLLMACAPGAAAQGAEASLTAPAAKPMEFRQTRYELRPGEPAQVSAADETLDFLLKAKSRRIQFAGTSTAGLVVGPNSTGDRILLAASLRTKPGEYAVTISATSATGEERRAAVSLVVQPRQTVPSGFTRPPVVLLNGWELGFTNSCPIATSSSDTFGNLASYLVSDGVPIVYLFDNCVEDPNQPIEVLGNDLGAYLNSIQYADGAQVPQIDLVAFSMGGSDRPGLPGRIAAGRGADAAGEHPGPRYGVDRFT